MKRYGKSIFFFSLFIFLFAGYSSVVAGYKLSNTVTVSQSHSTQDFYSSASTHSGHISIRHRSALQNESIVIACPTSVVYNLVRTSECALSYYSKWRTYFFDVEQCLPDQATLLPAFALRAPPVSC